MYGLILSLVFLAGCAAQGPPGGGPMDKTGPEMLLSFPENGTVNVDRKTGITMYFSETIEPRTAESNLVITPPPERPAIVKANRKRVTINFIDPLLENTTYIVSFGRDIQDYQKNRSDNNVTVAFSTGDSIDAGIINGTVYDIPNKHKAQVWAFRKKDSFPDSIVGNSPNYRTSVEKDGRFRLTNLARGDYRLLAVSSESPKITFIDENCLLGLPVIDPVAINHRDAEVSDASFRLGKFYLKPFRLLKASMANDKTELLFSRLLDMEQNINANIQITNDAQIQSFWLSDSEPNTMIFKALGMIPGAEYTVQVDGVVDDLGEMLKTNNTATFIYSNGADTLAPEIISTTLSNGTKNIALNANIRINFSEALKPVISDSSILFMSRDSILVDYSFGWRGENSIILSPKSGLASATEYRITCDCSGWIDLADNRFQDSLFTLSFSSVDVNNFGSISGRVNLSDTLVSHLMLACIPEKEGAIPVMILINGSGLYTIDNLLPGAYRFEIWEDLHDNGKWDGGKLKPFLPAEPYRSYPDVINIRARWETAEVDWYY